MSEAALTGREQDMELIRKYMLKMVPSRQRRIVAAGSERLVELEQELNEVKLAMAMGSRQGVRPAARNLWQNLKVWVNKKVR